MNQEHELNLFPSFESTASLGDVWIISDSLWEEAQTSCPEEGKEKSIRAISIHDQDMEQDVIVPMLTEMKTASLDQFLFRGKIYDGIKPISFDGLSVLFGLITKDDEANGGGLTQDEKESILNFLRQRLTWE